MVRSFFSLTQFFTAILPLLDSTTEFRFFYPGFFDGLISSCLVASKVLAPNTFEQVSSPYSPSSAFLSQDDPLTLYRTEDVAYGSNLPYLLTLLFL